MLTLRIIRKWPISRLKINFSINSPQNLSQCRSLSQDFCQFSKGFGFIEFGLGKKYRFLFGEFSHGKKYWNWYQEIWYKKSLGFGQNFGIVIQWTGSKSKRDFASFWYLQNLAHIVLSANDILLFLIFGHSLSCIGLLVYIICTKTSHNVTRLSYLCSESSLCQKCLQCTLCSLLCVLCVLAACENKSQSCLLCSRVGGTREVKTITRLLWQYTFNWFQRNPWCDHVDHCHNGDGDVFCYHRQVI